MSQAADDPPPFTPQPIEGTERIYDSAWCALRRDKLRLADGTLQEHHVFEVPDAVVVVPVLPDGTLLLIWQYRHALGGSRWEVPAGRMHAGEEPAAAARRELLEETGYRPGRLEPLAGFHPLGGISAHFAHVFRALDCERAGAPSPDASECIEVRAQDAERVRAWLAQGQLEDGFSALALHYHFARAGS